MDEEMTHDGFNCSVPPVQCCYLADLDNPRRRPCGHEAVLWALLGYRSGMGEPFDGSGWHGFCMRHGTHVRSWSSLIRITNEFPLGTDQGATS